ncbi:uncharacterized protein LOC142986735 [Anticarsia gemmatalis]|uniref:uncharacterized protein LOC142986735 n=1 Tax=Anticarsia gemmatalis TaxID=129554 RepID=UPI003F76A7F6
MFPGFDWRFVISEEESLDKTEKDLRAVDFDRNIRSLTDAKNNHQRWMKQYEDEHDHLRLEVDNIKDILNQLPDGCFKRIVLEPTEAPPSRANFR